MDWWFNPARTYDDNVAHGPFGVFSRPAPGLRAPQSPPLERTASTLLGEPVATPFGIAAGPLPTARHCAAAFDHGFDVNVYKTVRSRAVSAHPFPNTLAVRVDGDVAAHDDVTLLADRDFATATSISNSYGVPSPDPDQWQPDMALAVDAAGDGQLLVASFQGTRAGGDEDALVEDYAHTAALVAATGARALEMNLSCPNEGTSNLLCFDPELVARIVVAVRERIADQALVMKLAYFRDDPLLDALVTKVAPFIDGIAAINTLPARLVNAAGQQALPGVGRESAGVCGAGIRWAGLEMATRLSRIRDRVADQTGKALTIIGVGGVLTVADYQAYRGAGADAVMSATGAMRDPGLGAAVQTYETAAPAP